MSHLAAKKIKQQTTAAGFGSATAPKKTDKLRSISSNKTPGAGSKALRQSALAFDRIRKERGKDACADVYVRSPLDSPTRFWFVGKVAYESEAATVEAACLSQKRIILEYAQQELRPQNMGGRYASALEVWTAPPDSEMDIVRNLYNLTKVEGNVNDLPDDFTVNTVGYNPEIYVGDERTDGGLRVERDESGRPTKPVFDVPEPQVESTS